MADPVEVKEREDTEKEPLITPQLGSPLAPSVSSLSTESQSGVTFTESHLVKFKHKFFEVCLIFKNLF